MDARQPNPITVSFRGFLALSDLVPRKARELIALREVDSVLIGKRRYIFVQSYEDYLARERVRQAQPLAGGEPSASDEEGGQPSAASSAPETRISESPGCAATGINRPGLPPRPGR
jgi:hypothetical protein